MKICVVGPVYPYRGGISHHTTLMSKALRKRHEVINISYSLQYPRILYRRGDQKVYSDDSWMKIEGTLFCLNSLNPISWVMIAKKINKLDIDLLIIPWWHPYFAPSDWVILKLVKKSTRVLFICHNVLPHEPFPMQCYSTKSVLANGDFFIVHSDQEEQQIRKLIPNGNYKIQKNVHPADYDIFKRGMLTQYEARDKLGLPERAVVLLFFGFVRGYKGLNVLLDAFPGIRNKTDCRLLIVGEFKESEKAYYQQKIKEADNRTNTISVIDSYVPDSEVGTYFSACDIVVLPYLSATQSGVVTIAYGFGKPVIVTAVGGLPEVVANGETGYVIPPNNPAALRDTVLEFANDRDRKRFSKNIHRERHRFSWDRLVEVIEEIQTMSQVL